IAGFVLRVLLGVVMFPHGAQKLLGWFGGYGFSGTMGFFTDTMGIPAVFAFLVIMSEFFGSLALIAGAITRLAAFGAGCVMLGAILMVHLPNGFFMNWAGKQQGEGFEFHLLAMAIAVALMIIGGGRWSIDGLLTRKN
ncbi:MAG: DoxX family protein, partial [Desulfobacterales bacterium]